MRPDDVDQYCNNALCIDEALASLHKTNPYMQIDIQG